MNDTIQPAGGGSDMAPAGGSEPTNFTTSIPHEMLNPTATTEVGQPEFDFDKIDFKSVIPPEYQDRKYWDKISNFNDMFKSFDGAQSLIGKKMPDVPLTVDGYQYELPEGLPENFNFNEEEFGSFKEFAKEINLTPDQFAAIMDLDVKRKTEALQNMSAEDIDLAEKENQLNDEFDGMLKEYFGDEADSKMNKIESLLSKYAPEGMGDLAKDLDNSSLAAMALILDGVINDYVGEDIPSGGGEPGAPQQDLDALYREAKEIQANRPTRRNDFDPKYKAGVKRENEIYEILSRYKYFDR